MKSTFLCEVFVLRLSDNVSHLGVFFGLLSAFSAGATYVVIRFLGTAKADEFVWICWSFNEGSWMFWRLLSVLGIPDFAWNLAGRLGFSAAFASIGSDRHLAIRACCVRSTTEAKFSEFSVWQCDTEFLSLLHTLSEFNNQNRSNPSRKSKICPTKKRWCKNQIREYTRYVGGYVGDMQIMMC